MTKTAPKTTHAVLMLAGAAAALVVAAPASAAPAAVLKSFAELPDWTGVWTTDTKNGTLFDPASADPPNASAQRPGDRMHPPYKPEWEAKYLAILKKGIDGYYTDILTECLPTGFPRNMVVGFGMEFVLRPEQVWIQLEYGEQVRRIYTDGKGHPDDIWPTWTGNSVGHWEGDTLVVDTIGLNDKAPFDRTGAPHSEQLHVVERLRKTGPTRIEDDMTIDDPVAFTRQWHVVRYFKKLPPGSRIDDFVCEESQRNPIVDGQTQVVLPSDKPGYVLGAAPDPKYGQTARAPTAIH